MAKGIENIGKQDVAWSYAATFFTIGAGVILLPFMLHKLPAETIGIWTIFQTINMLVIMLDFGFRPSFSRNISYIFSGVKRLKKEGVETAEHDSDVDYALLNGTLKAMRWFYSRIALLVLLLLGTIGSAYMYYLLGKYTGNRMDIVISWLILIFINCYNLYTLYYDVLLTGKGYIRQSQQINLLGNLIYITLAIALIYSGLGLSAIIASQFVSILIRRILSHRVFFNREMKKQLSQAGTMPFEPILKAIYPNAVKSGLTSVGGFLVNKSAVFIGSIYLPLSLTASLGITTQVVEVMARCGLVIYNTYLPKLAQYRVEKDISLLKKAYIYSTLSLVIVFLLGGGGILLLGNTILGWISSQTLLLPTAMTALLLFFYLLEFNHVIAAGFIMADNRIPFFIPSLISGAATLVLMLLFVSVFDWGVWGMILAPGLAQLAYQNWKWPSVVIKELRSN